MTAYTDDDVTAGTDVAYAELYHTDLSAQDCERVVTAVLDAVAPAIWKAGVLWATEQTRQRARAEAVSDE